MHRTYVYLPDQLRNRIAHTARQRNITKASLIREALEAGLVQYPPAAAVKSPSAKALVGLTETAQTFNGTAPKDLAQHHDKYLWD